jgi:hypothetical protein
MRNRIARGESGAARMDLDRSRIARRWTRRCPCHNRPTFRADAGRVSSEVVTALTTRRHHLIRTDIRKEEIRKPHPKKCDSNEDGERSEGPRSCSSQHRHHHEAADGQHDPRDCQQHTHDEIADSVPTGNLPDHPRAARAHARTRNHHEYPVPRNRRQTTGANRSITHFYDRARSTIPHSGQTPLTFPFRLYPHCEQECR